MKPGSVAVVTDSTADLPAEQAEASGIQVVPALLTLDGQDFLDGRQLSRADFYARLPGLHQPAITAAPPPSAFEAAYDWALTAGHSRVFSIHISSKLSSMLDVAKSAARAFGGRIMTFDSQKVSMGLGFQALAAAGASAAGAGIEQILECALSARARARTLALINTLEYLKRSGRVAWLRAGVGELLRIKLLVSIVDGSVQRVAQIRTYQRALAHLAGIAAGWPSIQSLAVLHSNIPAAASDFAARLEPLAASPVAVVNVTTVIGAHVGPGSLGLAALLG
jgi:DegV family protein with EDD domain